MFVAKGSVTNFAGEDLVAAVAVARCAAPPAAPARRWRPIMSRLCRAAAAAFRRRVGGAGRGSGRRCQAKVGRVGGRCKERVDAERRGAAAALVAAAATAPVAAARAG